MKRILIPTTGPCQWRSLLGDPKEHWKRGRSALETAMSWESAQGDPHGRGLPAEVAAIFDRTPDLAGASLLFAIPEHQVNLDNAKAPSQNDVWALLRNERGLISISVEAKAGEPFGGSLDQWLNKNSKKSGREARLRMLCDRLNIPPGVEACGALRYQLFHRTVSAILEAERCGAFAAVMLVQAFPGAKLSFTDFEAFGAHLGVTVKTECIVEVPFVDHLKLFLGWVSSPVADDELIANTIAKPS